MAEILKKGEKRKRKYQTAINLGLDVPKFLQRSLDRTDPKYQAVLIDRLHLQQVISNLNTVFGDLVEINGVIDEMECVKADYIELEKHFFQACENEAYFQSQLMKKNELYEALQ